jgi:prepilin-type N-terminal cleavage/methylation domain-containing protein
MRKERGFTILEILVCTAIIAILAAFLFPIFRSAKRAGKETETISNLRQCFASIQLYDENALSIPNYESAVVALEKSATHDPADYWNKGTGDQSKPMIHSYAYIRGVEYAFGPDEVWNQFVIESEAKNGSYPILAAVWHGSPRQEFVSSTEQFPPSLHFSECRARHRCMIPNRTSYLFSTGRCRTFQFHERIEVPLYWDHVFQPQHTTGRWIH